MIGFNGLFGGSGYGGANNSFNDPLKQYQKHVNLADMSPGGFGGMQNAFANLFAAQFPNGVPSVTSPDMRLQSATVNPNIVHDAFGNIDSQLMKNWYTNPTLHADPLQSYRNAAYNNNSGFIGGGGFSSLYNHDARKFY